MRGIRKVVTLVAGLLVATLLATGVGLGLSSERASAASPVVLVSTDGITYQPNLAVGLFDNAGLLVPGDTAISQLWIKNPTSTPATVRVNIGDVNTASVAFADNVRLTAVNSANGSTISETWNQLTHCDIMVQPVTIAGHAAIRVDLTLTMLDAPGLVAQHQDGSLTADISMRDAAGGSFPVSTCDPATQPTTSRPAKILGNTGETFPTGLLLLGSLLVGVGWFLVVARRRRRREAE